MGAYVTPDTVRKAWGLWCTGPHVAWHLVDLYSSRADAEDRASQFKKDGHTDGIIIRRVTMEPAVMNWDRAER